jgi:hypothetical protein
MKTSPREFFEPGYIRLIFHNLPANPLIFPNSGTILALPIGKLADSALQLRLLRECSAPLRSPSVEGILQFAFWGAAEVDFGHAFTAAKRRNRKLYDAFSPQPDEFICLIRRSNCSA